MSTPIPLIVEAYSGYKADERPMAFQLGDQRVGVQEILDRWYGEDYAYFKLTGEDKKVYIIRHNYSCDIWELIRIQVPSTPSPQGEG